MFGKLPTYYNVTLPATSGNKFTLEVIKNTELITIPMLWSISEGSPAVTFNGLTVPSSCTLSAPPQRPARRLEFVGDSITCGYGNLASSFVSKAACVMPPGGWVGYEDFSLSWPTRVSKDFNAEQHTQCVSNV